MEGRYGDMEHHSHCGRFRITKKRWWAPYAHITYRVEMFDDEGNVVKKTTSDGRGTDDPETFAEAKEMAEFFKDPTIYDED